MDRDSDISPHSVAAALEQAGTSNSVPPVNRSRVLLVDAEQLERTLFSRTLAILDAEIAEASSLEAAATQIRSLRPHVVVLGPNFPAGDPVSFCRELDECRHPRARVVVIGQAPGGLRKRVLREAGVDALLPSPCGPLELLETVEAFVNGEAQLRLGATSQRRHTSEVLAYADDLRRLLELERGQRALLRQAYRQSVEVLATALATKDTGTRAHSQRVQRYARHLAAAIAGDHAVNSSLDCGFLLHDVGKIGIPNSILLKPGPLTPSEQRVMQTHTILGEQMVSDIPLLRGAGLGVVRSHHERWDGRGYPDRMSGEDIPLGARVFAIADALDAMTTERPYRRSSGWSDAVTEITAQRGRQFDPRVVDAFAGIEGELHDIYLDLAAA